MKQIEILAPAGSPEQGLKAIQAGCHALYGGLKFGSARNRAKNFSEEEYQEMLDYCHEHHVKFYLTMNTLFRNDELEKAIQILKRIQLPDAILIADIGLMLAVRKEFPMLPIHASTQFGTATLTDVRFLEKIGVKRAVLSRELSLDEIKHIRQNTSMELEVFVFGSQCILFSGQCLWGGLINESSGNRGRCIGMCRDLYKSGDIIGQLMYPRDMELGEHIDQLQKLGIDSLKIEGRLRDPEETESVVAQRSNRSFYNGYGSYLENHVPVNGMLNVINPRIKFSHEKANTYGKHDMLYFDGKICYGDNLSDEKEYNYLKTVFTSKLIPGAVNIYIRFKFVQRELSEIDFVNTFGERKVFQINRTERQTCSVSELYEFMEDKISYNIYECVSEVPENEKIYVDFSAVVIIADAINQLCHDANQTFSDTETSRKIDALSAVIQTDNLNDIITFKNYGFRNFVFEISDISKLKKVLLFENDEINLYYRFPVLDFTDSLDKIAQMLIGKKVMITRLSQILFIEKNNYSVVSADYTVNAWNDVALDFLKENKIDQVTTHPELSLEYSINIIKNAGLTPSVIIYGRVPLGFTRACFKELNICHQSCKESIKMENVNKGYGIEIKCGNQFGFRTAYREGIDVVYSEIPNYGNRYLINSISDSKKNELLHLTSDIHKCNILYRRSVK